jgi:hypothetical protein
MSGWWRLFREILVGSITETFGSLLSEYIRPFLPWLIPVLIWVSAAIISWLEGWLFQAILVQVWVLIVGSFTVLLVPSIIHRLHAHSLNRSLQKHHDVLWKFVDGKLRDGPFCPKDKRTLKVVQSHQKLSDMISYMKLPKQNEPFIILRCPQCDFEKYIEVEKLEQLWEDVQDYIAAKNR